MVYGTVCEAGLVHIRLEVHNFLADAMNLEAALALEVSQLIINILSPWTCPKICDIQKRLAGILELAQLSIGAKVFILFIYCLCLFLLYV